MTSLRISFFLSILLLCSVSFAAEMRNPGDISGSGLYRIYNYTNITANRFCFTGGTCFTSVGSGSGSSNISIGNYDAYITLTTNGTVLNGSANLTAFDARYPLLTTFNLLYTNVTSLQTTIGGLYTNLSAEQALSVLFSRNDTDLRIGMDSLNTTKGNLSAVNGSVNQVAVYLNGTATYGVPQFLFTYVSGMGIHTFTGSSAGSAIYTAGSSGTFRGESSVMRIGGLNRPLELSTGASGVTPGILIDNTQNVAIGVPYSNSTGAWDKTSKLYVNGTVNITDNVAVDSNTLFVDATNNRVGIGNTAPNTSLHVSGGINVSGTGSNSIYQLTDGVSTMALWTTSLGFISEEGVARIVGANSNLTFHSGGTRNSMAQGTTQGQIGTDGWCVNCTDANSSLYVVGDGTILNSVNTPSLNLLNTFAGRTETFLINRPGVGGIYMTTAGGTPATANIGAKDSSSVSYSSISIGTSSGATIGKGDITIGNGGSILLPGLFVRYNATNVGIGTAVPSSTLEVNGTVNVSSTLYVDGTKCTSGQVLTTNPTTGALTCTTNTSLTAYANQSANFTCSAGQGLQSVAFNTDGTQNATGCFTPSGSGSGGNGSFNGINNSFAIFGPNSTLLGNSSMYNDGGIPVVGATTRDTGFDSDEEFEVSGTATRTSLLINQNTANLFADLHLRSNTDDTLIRLNGTGANALEIEHETVNIFNLSDSGNLSIRGNVLTIAGQPALTAAGFSAQNLTSGLPGNSTAAGEAYYSAGYYYDGSQLMNLAFPGTTLVGGLSGISSAANVNGSFNLTATGSGTGNVTGTNLTANYYPIATSATNLQSSNLTQDAGTTVVNAGSRDTGFDSESDLEVSATTGRASILANQNTGGLFADFHLRSGTEDTLLRLNSSQENSLQIDWETINLLNLTNDGSLDIRGNLTARSVVATNFSGQISCLNITGGTDSDFCTDGGGAGGTPGGAASQIQYHGTGGFAGNSNFTYDNSTNDLSVLGGNIIMTEPTGSGDRFVYFNQSTNTGFGYLGGNDRLAFQAGGGTMEFANFSEWYYPTATNDYWEFESFRSNNFTYRFFNQGSGEAWLQAENKLTVNETPTAGGETAIVKGTLNVTEAICLRGECIRDLAGGAPAARYHAAWIDDFYGQASTVESGEVGMMGWDTFLGGTAAAASISSDRADAGRTTLNLTTGSTNGGNVTVSLNPGMMFVNATSGLITQYGAFSIGAVALGSGVANNVTVLIGFGDTNAATAAGQNQTDSIALMLNTTVGHNNFSLVTRSNAGAQTTNTTSVALVTNQMIRYEIRIYNNTKVELYLNEVLSAESTANIPSGNLRAFGPQIKLIKTGTNAGTAAVNLGVDYYGLEHDFETPR